MDKSALQYLPDSLGERSLRTSEGTEKLFARWSKDLKTKDFSEPDEVAETVRAEFEECLAKASAGGKRAVRESRERCSPISRAIRPDIDGIGECFGISQIPLEMAGQHGRSGFGLARRGHIFGFAKPRVEPDAGASAGDGTIAPSWSDGETSGAKRLSEGSPEDGTTGR